MTLNKYLHRLVLGLLLGFLALPNSALADCTSPDVPEGSTKYFVADQVFKYCSGTAWVSMGCEMALNEQTRIITTTSASAQNYVVPADWNSSDNRIEVIGAGGSGDDGGATSRAAGGGGGGGAYSRVSNVTLTPNGTVSFFINTAGSDTWFGGSSFATATVAAEGGAFATGGTGGIGGLAANGIGTVKYSGGSSGICIGTSGGCGGGGAAGPNGDGGHGAGAGLQGGHGGGGANGGSTGVSSSSFTGGSGGSNRLGQGSNGGGGSGGNASNSFAVTGTVCSREAVWFDYTTLASDGPSGGGGGGGRDNGAAPSRPGDGGDCSVGAGGGGGGVGSSSAASASWGGTGRQGLIAITYRSATPICTKISACTVARRLYYNATVNSYVVCNGTYEYKLGSADTGIPCTEVGAYKYNVGLAKQTYCDGSFWRSFE